LGSFLVHFLLLLGEFDDDLGPLKETGDCERLFVATGDRDRLLEPGEASSEAPSISTLLE